MKIKLPEPPLLSMSFYRTNIKESILLMELLACALDIGAKVIGEVSYCEGIDIKKKRFASIMDLGVPSYKNLSTLNEIMTFQEQENINIINIPLRGILTNCQADFISVIPISEEAKNIDTHPVSWTTSGTCFEFFDPYFKKASGFGDKIYQIFKIATQRIDPVYASINTEYYLPCLTDIKIDDKSMAFQDFFINSKYFSKEKLDELKNVLFDYYCETLENGIYFSRSPFFNPEKVEVDGTISMYRSAEVARLLISK
ncbi:MAG: hypothetical protein R2828_05215 [Saprospiraceae bacterium]